MSPPGARIARWYCRREPCTFSLLPDCLAARLCGDLAEVEGVVGAVEQAESLEAACTLLRPEIEFGAEVPDTSVLDELHEKAHDVCFIANSVKTEITVEQVEPKGAMT